MHIIHVATELATVIKAGGLGDVTYGLSLELVRDGHKVSIILPKYKTLDLTEVTDFHKEPNSFNSPFDNQMYSNDVWKGMLKDVELIFIDPKHPHQFFDRDEIYGYHDDANRFLYFTRAVLEYIAINKINADAINIHDWHTAAFAPLYKEYMPSGTANIVLSIHNLEYQGRCSLADPATVGLDVEKHQLRDPTYPNDAANLLKGGIIYADMVVTVSPNYLTEIRTPEGGKGLEGVILQNWEKFRGILNGIDPEYWNPATDPHIPCHYSDEKPLDIKKALQKRLNLEQTDAPIVGVVVRLVPQKGLELIKYAMEYMSTGLGQFVLLGSSPIQSIQDEFQVLKEKYKDNPNISLTLKHEEDLAHLIFAGSDILLIPSLFEPCGLTQLIGFRYGTVPIVRKTGGLADTVKDGFNGFTFIEPTNIALKKAMDDAINCKKNDPVTWKSLISNGMKNLFDWKKSAKSYISIYTERDSKIGF